MGEQKGAIQSRPWWNVVLTEDESKGGIDYRYPKKALTLWRKRLFTRMDRYRVHGLPSTVFILYTLFSMVRVLISLEFFKQIPSAESSWVPPLLFWTNIVKDISGVRLAYLYKKGIVFTFLVMSGIASTMSTLAIYYFDPSFPSALDWIARCVALMALPAQALTIPFYLAESLQIVKLRQDPRQQDGSVVSKMVGIVWYVFPLIIPLWLSMNSSYMIAIGGSHFKNYATNVFPQVSNVIYSLMVISVSIASLGPAAGTLRIRRLIGTAAEMILAALLFVCLCFVFIDIYYGYQDSKPLLLALMNPVNAFQVVKDATVDQV